MHCTSVYEENHAFLTFTASATHFLWSTTQTSYRAKALFCKNNNYGVLVELRSPVSGNKECPNLLKKRKTHESRYFFIRLTDRIVSGCRIAKKLSVNQYVDNPTLIGF